MENPKKAHHHFYPVPLLVNEYGASYRRLLVLSSGSWHLIPLDEIIRLESEGNYITFFTTTRKVVTINTMKHYIEILPEEMFFQSHQSHIVNLAFIEQVSFREGCWLHLKNGDVVPVAHTRKDSLKQVLMAKSLK